MTSSACQWRLTRSPQRKLNEPGADGLVGQLIDDDKRAQSLVLGIRRKRHQIGRNSHSPCAISFKAKRPGGKVRAGVDVQTVLDVRDGHARGFGVDQRGIRTARQQGMLAHPQELRFKLVRALNRMRRGRDHVAAAGIDFVVKDQGNGLAGSALPRWNAPETTIF